MALVNSLNTFVRIVLILALAAFVPSLQALEISNRYRSPRNPERSIRRSTELIVLHTTEAPARSSLNKLSDRGEAHFCVTEDGTVYAIVDRDREAFHAGRSMWNGKEDVDKYSIGIECVGHHDKPMGIVQLNAISQLVKRLQAMYHIPDHCVVCHSHVAYGAPNKWQKRNHRGRKRCGMLFATATIRRILGLRTRPASDVDVRARRLIVGDPGLERVLYGGADFLAGRYPQKRPVTQPRPAAIARLATITSKKPKTTVKIAKNRGTVPTVNPVGTDPKIRGTDPKSKGTDPKVRGTDPKSKGSVPTGGIPKSSSELKARGFVLKGKIGPGKTAIKLAGSKWNSADTYYVIRGKLTSGKSIDPAHIEKGTEVWSR